MLRTWQPELVQIEGLELARYIPVIRKHSQAQVLLDQHNSEHALQASIAAEAGGGLRGTLAARYSRIQAGRLRTFERTSCELSDMVTVVTEEDARSLRDLGYEGPFRVVPNGIQTADYDGIQHRPPTPARFLFTGTMDYRPNVDAVTWFSREVWNGLADRGWQLQIVGRTPAPQVSALASESIEVTGTVADIRPFLETATAVVVPLRMGSGSRLKVLEAMAAGVPVISSSVGMAGIDATADNHYLRADSAAEWKAALETVAANPSAAEERAGRARHLVRERYDWQRILPAMDEAQALAVRSRARSGV
jgi:glycosyltransferase involved in cell wall biosynthesis